MKRVILAAMIIAMGAGASYAQQTEVQPVQKVDLQRYAGKWYEVARLPNRFQEQCAGNVSAEYALKPDGDISVTNKCSRADGKTDSVTGVAKVVGDSGNARLKVRFAPDWLAWVPFVWGDYWVLGLAPDYSYAVVGEPERKNLWILSRTPTLPQSAWNEAVDVAASQGFETDRLVKTPQGR